MKIFVKVKPNAKANTVEKIDENQYLVKVKAPAKENKANKELIKILAEYFNTSQSRISILQGSRSRIKVISINV